MGDEGGIRERVAGGGRRRQFVRAVTELAVIVVGVLIALTADAWYERRSDRELESALIRDLLVEFRANEEALRNDIRANETSYAAAEAATELFARPLTDLVMDSLASLRQTFGALPRYDPGTGVLSGIIGGGQLALIDDGVLRGELAGWMDQVEALKLNYEGLTSTALVFVQVWSAPMTPRTAASAQMLWAQHLFLRRFMLDELDDLHGSTVALIESLEAAASG
jgi:CRP-like cAMP-binding protein